MSKPQQPEAIVIAASALIGAVRAIEQDKKQRSSMAELTLEVELTGGGREIWTITIERTVSTH
jgi:hypothetical protein